MAVDVTDRRRAEDALRESERKYRVLVEEQGLGIGSMNGDERFIYANRAGHEIFGVPPGALVGRSLLEFTDESNFTVARQQTGLRRAGEGSTYEMQIRRPTGEVRTIMVTASPEYDREGRYVSTIGIFRDVTGERAAEDERRKLEAKLQQAQKLESLGVLAGGIAHDFNNLLAAVLGNVSYALSELSHASPVHQSLKEIERSAQRAAELTRQLLAYAGQGRFFPQRIDLSAAVAEMGSLLRSSVPKKCQLELRPATGLPAVEVDLAQLRQVVMNLVTNGAEALGDATGTVTVSTGAARCDRAQRSECVLDATGDVADGEYAFVEVRDTGCGVAPELQGRIFDPFYSTKFAGRGLGLSAVLGIVRSHRGALCLASTPGEGTVVRALFPAAPPAARATAAPARAPATGRNILVVDDESMVCSMVRRILERAGYVVTVALNGREALEMFRADPALFDLVLLDLTMPEMDGAETFAELRRLRPDIRVLLTSGYSEEEATMRFVGKGLDGFLQKPYVAGLLVRAAGQALSK
jgi:PAS domain S-box-containing protein